VSRLDRSASSTHERPPCTVERLTTDLPLDEHPPSPTPHPSHASLFRQPLSARKNLRESARPHQVLHIDGLQRYSPKTEVTFDLSDVVRWVSPLDGGQD
jgi:hypothetical protein